MFYTISLAICPIGNHFKMFSSVNDRQMQLQKTNVNL